MYFVLAWVGWVVYNRGMMRNKPPRKGHSLTVVSDLHGRTTHCDVQILNSQGRMIHHVLGVRYGLAITNIMTEWGCIQLRYTPKAANIFLKKGLDLTPST